MVVTTLEAAGPRRVRVPPPAGLPLALLTAERMPSGYLRYLCDAVGCMPLDEPETARALDDGTRRIGILHAGGTPAGFYVLAPSLPQSVGLSYFGLMPDMRGRGLGRLLAAAAVDAAWAVGPERLTAAIGERDHVGAFRLLQQFGFVPTGRRTIGHDASDERM